jgi:N-acetylglutamate synthase-like GNAT family acetyltransferase
VRAGIVLRVSPAGPGPTLRRATVSDVAAIESLVAAAGLPLDGLAACVVGGTAIAAVDRGRLVGVAATERHGRAALLRSVAVDPSARGRGLGRLLVARALDDARASGAREAWLLTETAAAWFAGLGWQGAARSAAPSAIAASTEFTTACPASAVALRRPL